MARLARMARMAPSLLVNAPVAASPSGERGLVVRVLGGLEVNGARGEALGDLHARFHVRALLAWLAAAPEGIAREDLVESLWPEQPAGAARNRLHHTVHLLRRALGALAWDADWVVVAQGRVALDGAVCTDAHRVQRAAQRAHAGTLEHADLSAALALCAEWMPGLDLGQRSVQLREHLRAQHALLLQEAARREAGAGDTPRHRAVLADLLRLQPTDEWAYQQMMRLDLDLQRPHAVLKTFDAAAAVLAERLGLRPSALSLDLAAQATARLSVSDADPGKQLGARGNASSPGLPLRRAAPGLVGRETLLAQLVAAWLPAGGIWNLSGLSGVGKTALAAEASRRCSAAFPDGVFWLRCGDLARDESAALAGVRALGLTPAPGQPASAQVAHSARTRRMLVVLDDIDHAADGALLLAALAERPLCATVVAITRLPLALAGVHPVPVPALELPAADLPLAQAVRCASVMLFEMRAPQPPDPHDSRALADVVRLVGQLDGLPLAIELAAARTLTMTPGEIARQLEQTLQPLDGGPVDLDPRHRSAQAALDWSAELLGPAAAQVYCAVAVHPGWFQPDGVAALLASAGLDVPHPQAALDDLLHAGLLQRAPQGSALRLLHLPRAHARGRARQSGLWPRLAQAHTEQVHARLQALPLDFESPLYTENLSAVAGVHDDAHGLLEHAQHAQPRLFVDMVQALCEFWIVRAQGGLGLAWCPRALVAARALGLREAEAVLALQQARLVDLARRSEEAATLAQEALALARQVAAPALPTLVAYAANVLAGMLGALGRAPEAKALCDECLHALALQDGMPGYWTLRARAWFLHPGLLPVAAENLAPLRARFAGSGVWITLLRAACQQADLAADRAQQLALSGQLAQAGLALAAPNIELMGLWERGWCEMRSDELADFGRTMDRMYQVSRGAGLDHRAALAARSLAELHWRSADYERAERSLVLAEELLAPLNDAGGRLDNLLGRAMLHALRGQIESAAGCGREAITQALRSRDEVVLAAAELGAVLAGLVQEKAAQHAIATLLRRLDEPYEGLPVVQRFRDKHVGPAVAGAALSPEMARELTLDLRAQLDALARRLAQLATK